MMRSPSRNIFWVQINLTSKMGKNQMREKKTENFTCFLACLFVGLAYQGKDIVFRFITEYSSLRDFGP
jgi:hypothetical protein